MLRQPVTTVVTSSASEVTTLVRLKVRPASVRSEQSRPAQSEQPICGYLESRQLSSSSHMHGELHLEPPRGHSLAPKHLSDPIPSIAIRPPSFTQKHSSGPQDGERESEQSELAHCLQPSCVFESRQSSSSSHAHGSLPGHSQPEAPKGTCARVRAHACGYAHVYACVRPCMLQLPCASVLPCTHLQVTGHIAAA